MHLTLQDVQGWGMDALWMIKLGGGVFWIDFFGFWSGGFESLFVSGHDFFFGQGLFRVQGHEHVGDGQKGERWSFEDVQRAQNSV